MSRKGPTQNRKELPDTFIQCFHRGYYIVLHRTNKEIRFSMATIVPLQTAKTPGKEKLPSFDAEAKLFIDYGNVRATTTIPTSSKRGNDSSYIANAELYQPRKTAPDTQMLPATSTLSFQEIFDTDDVTLSQISGFDGQQNRIEAPGDGDEWFNGDGDLLAKETKSSDASPVSPLCVYTKQYLPDGSNESDTNHDATNHKWSNGPSYDSGRTTPVSVSGSQTTSQLGSMSSNNSLVQRGGSIPKPLLYSAIGSLEHPTAVSIGSLDKRLVNKRKEFCQLGGESSLIPRANLSSNQQSLGPATVDDKKNSKGPAPRPPGLLNYIATPPAPKKENLGRENIDGGDQNDQKQIHSANESISAGAKAQRPSNLRQKKTSTTKDQKGKTKRVSYNRDLEKKKPKELFRPSCDAYTPRIEKKSIKYRAAELRTPVQKMATPMGTLQRPNFRDALRRVAMIIHQHIVKIERRFEVSDAKRGERGLFKVSMKEMFSEEKYCTPTYNCTMVRIPMARPGMVYGLRKINTKPKIPSEEEIYDFAHQLFKAVQLSSECSIVCLIYVERLMEIAKVPLLACTWRPIFMCGLLLASKVWQDLSSWNIEFASVYPQYPLDAINRLELNFLRNVKWDLYISSRYVKLLSLGNCRHQSLPYSISTFFFILL